MDLLVIAPPAETAEDGARLAAVLKEALSGYSYGVLTDMSALPELRGRRLLFALALGRHGINTAYTRLLLRLRADTTALEGCTAALVVDGAGELYTKSTAAELALAANLAGCALIGRPLVEATGPARTAPTCASWSSA